MNSKIDTGKRRVVAQCDLYGIVAAREHYKEFPDQLQAELFLKTSNLRTRGYIQPVLETVKIVVPALPAADPDTELAEMVKQLTDALRVKDTKDSPLLRRRLFALQRLLAGRLA